MLGQIDVFESLFAYITQVIQLHNTDAAGDTNLYLQHIVAVLDTLDTSLFQVASVALCVHICGTVADILHLRGMRILPSVIGVILGYTVVAVYDMPIMVTAFLFLLLFVIDLIFVRVPTFSIFKLCFEYLIFAIKMTIDIVNAVFVTGFIAVLLILTQGGALDFAMTVFMIFMFVLPLVILSAAKRYILP